MQELFVLVEEHVAVRGCLDQLEEAVRAPEGTPSGGRILGLLDQLTAILGEFHLPKEEAVLLPRVAESKRLPPSLVRRAMQEEKRLVDAFAQVAARLRQDAPLARGALVVELVPVIRALRNAMDWQEQVLYPCLYDACDEQELWNLSVELDRCVDVAGRQQRERMIAPAVFAMRQLAEAM